MQDFYAPELMLINPYVLLLAITVHVLKNEILYIKASVLESPEF